MKAKTVLSTLVVAAVAIAAIVAAPAVRAASTGTNDTGTKLSVTIEAEDGDTCGEVDVHYSVLSTAAADAATVEASVDGVVDPTLATTIASGNVADGGGWTFTGRTKTAEGEFAVSLSEGSHTIEVCATQKGSGGRTPKTVCQDAEVAVDGCLPIDVCDGLGGCISACQGACGQDPDCRSCCECSCKDTLGCSPQNACFEAHGPNPACLQ